MLAAASLAAHGSKTAARVFVTPSPEPVSNIALSSSEDVAAGDTVFTGEDGQAELKLEADHVARPAGILAQGVFAGRERHRLRRERA